MFSISNAMFFTAIVRKKMSENGKSLPDAVPPNETRRILKNVLVLSFAFMLQFTGDHGAENLQSSINAESGLGTASLAATYTGVLLSSLFLPVVFIKCLGTKWTMTLCFGLYLPYIVVQMWPSFYTLIPAGFLMGLVGAPVWCSMCTYLAIMSEAHSKISKIPAEVLLPRFLGLFFMIFRINQLWGNLIASLVLMTEDNEAARTTVNESMIPLICGANFLPRDDAGKALPPQPPEKIQMLVGIYSACMVGAILVTAFGVDSTKRYSTAVTGSETKQSGLELMIVTMKVTVEPNQLLLSLISIYIGLSQAFVTADFSAAFVSCTIGTGTLGYVLMTNGLSDAIGCALTGYIAKLTGRVKLICIALVVNSLLLVTLLVWRPQAHLGYVLYILAVLFGLCNSVWLVQINAYYGILFPGREEAAFANFRLFEAIGFIITYSVSSYFNTIAKTYLLLGTMLIGSVGYFIVEYKQRRVKKTWDVTSDEKDKGCVNVAYVH